MKSDIHPKVHDVVFHDTSSGAKFISQSTKTGKEKITISGKEYSVIKVEISSKSHPFYTGEERIIKTGRVEKFLKKRALAQKKQDEKVKKVEKGDELKAAKESVEKKVEKKDEKNKKAEE